MITLYRINHMQDVYYIWVPTEEEEQFQEYYADPDYVVTKLVEAQSDRDIELIEVACDEINGRLLS